VSSQSIHVNIFGDEYSIKGDVDVETTRKVAEYVNNKIRETHEKSASHNKLKIAILSALNIAGELFEKQQQLEDYENFLQNLEQKAHDLSDRIDSEL